MTGHLDRLVLATAARRLSTALPLLLVALAVPPAARAEREPERQLVRAAAPGPVVLAPDDESPAELVTLGDGVAALLLALPPEAEVRIADWPVAPEMRADVVLARHEVYAPDARIFEVRGTRLVEVPRSRLTFFSGVAEADPDTRVFVSVDPVTGELSGFTQSPEGMHELRPLGVGRDGAPRHLVAASEAFAEALPGDGAETGGEPTWSCGQEALPRPLAQATAPSRLDFLAAPAITTLHTATIAVDTDNELMARKFSNNTTNATNYVAALIAGMSVMYERDLKVRLLQGTTFLRVSTTPDPYVQPCGAGTTDCSSGAATGAQLQEFSSYWAGGCGGACRNVSRALTMMLSGKQSSTNSAAGIAWLGGLCSGSSGYSFSQVFRSPSFTAANDVKLVGHELGHNFGSQHTHCYSPPIDNCFNGEAGAGCYGGTQSCPATSTINGVTNVRGTVMSYCHLLGSCGASTVFHPRTVDLLNPIIESRVNTCIFPAVLGPTVAAINPRSGSTAGNTQVTITGTGFAAGATVSIGGVPATGVVVSNGTTLTALTGAHATGTVSVTVTNPGGLAGTLSNSYFYAPPPTPLGFHTVTPCRILDTRNANGPLGGPALAPGAQRTFTVTGTCGVPAGAKSLSVNVTIVTPSAPGHLTFFPGNAFPMGTSTISFSPGQVRATNAVLPLATDGTGRLAVQNAANGTTHLILDVNGYFQ